MGHNPFYHRSLILILVGLCATLAILVIPLVVGAANVEKNNGVAADRDVVQQIPPGHPAANVEKNNGVAVDRDVVQQIPPGHPFPIDSRVVAVVDYPSGSSCIMAGFTGTLYCYDPNDPVLPYLVNWDNAPPCTFEQCQVCGRCAPNGWWVGFDEIELEIIPVDSRVRAVVDYPSGSSCIMAGFTGTLYCYDPNDPVLPYLVNWDNAPPCTFEQCQVCGRCAPNGWWVGFGEIVIVELVPALAVADFDGDGETDNAVFRRATGVWWINPSGPGTPYPVGFGGHSSDIAVAEDYEGDGQADIAVYRSASGVWWIRPSSTGTPYPVGFGGHPSDIPVPGDYDGDGQGDIAIYRSASGVWWIRPSSTGTPYPVGFGGHPSDIPVPGDYDGDGQGDIAIYRSASGVWWIRPSSTGTPYAVGFGGHPSDMPVNPACIHLY